MAKFLGNHIFEGKQRRRLGGIPDLATKNAAEAVGLDEAGRLEPGMLADFLLLEDDPWEMDPEKLGNVRVWRTYRGGELLFERTR